MQKILFFVFISHIYKRRTVFLQGVGEYFFIFAQKIAIRLHFLKSYSFAINDIKLLVKRTFAIRFAICQRELSTPTDISIPLTRRLVLRALEAGECLSAFKPFFFRPEQTFHLNSEIRLVVGQSLKQLHVFIARKQNLADCSNVPSMNRRLGHILLLSHVIAAPYSSTPDSCLHGHMSQDHPTVL